MINPKNFYTDRCIRLFRCENELVHKVIRYQTASNIAFVAKDGSPVLENSDAKFLRCSNPDVVCSQLDGVSLIFEFRNLITG